MCVESYADLVAVTPVTESADCESLSLQVNKEKHRETEKINKHSNEIQLEAMRQTDSQLKVIGRGGAMTP